MKRAQLEYLGINGVIEMKWILWYGFCPNVMWMHMSEDGFLWSIFVGWQWNFGLYKRGEISDYHLPPEQPLYKGYWLSN